MVVSVLLALGVMARASPPAWAAPPSNDDGESAQALQPPQTVTGTLVEATLEATNDYAVCDTVGASVWYRFTAPPPPGTSSSCWMRRATWTPT